MGRSAWHPTALVIDSITVFISFAFVLCLDARNQKVVCYTPPCIVSCL